MTQYHDPKTEDPFGGWPYFEIVRKGQGVRLKGSYISPSKWWSEGFGRFVALISLVALPVTCMRATADVPEVTQTEEMFQFTVMYGIAALALVWCGSHFGQKRNLDVIVRPDNIRINGRNYRREEGFNQFEIEPHEKAHIEAKAEHETQKRQSRVYRDAVQVVMRYGAQRVVVASFRDKDVRHAESLQFRLQFLAQPKGMEQYLAMNAPAPKAAPAPAEQDDFGAERPIR